jgi:hypothetical protein
VDFSGKPWLDGLAAFDASAERYRYNRTGEDNADAHLEHQLMGPEVVWAVISERLLLDGRSTSCRLNNRLGCLCGNEERSPTASVRIILRGAW